MGKFTQVCVLNGPNLNLLGLREPHIYGTNTLEEINLKLEKIANEFGAQFEHFQSNSESALIDFLNQKFIDLNNNQYISLGFIINFAAYSHTSIALRDALSVFPKNRCFIYEVHLSNIFARESFRHHSHMSAVVDGVICGLGAIGYEAALNCILAKINKSL